MTAYTLSGIALLKAGENINTKFTDTNAEANWAILIQQAEAEINGKTRFNWNSKYSELTNDVKFWLDFAASSRAAMFAIINDMSGFTSRLEAQTMLDVLVDGYKDAVKELTLIHNQTFIKNPENK